MKGVIELATKLEVELVEALDCIVRWYGKRDNTGDDKLLPIDQQEDEIADAMRLSARVKGEG